MKIFLFDLDGVLLESRGYHLALQETVRRMAKQLGFGDATLSVDDIAAFEACGITSEWDEAAICTAALLETAWGEEPEMGIPNSLAEPLANPSRHMHAPDFHALVQKLSTPKMLGLHPITRAERFFLESDHYNESQRKVLQELLLGARAAELSITHRTFQELVLGSTEFTQTYDLPGVLGCEGFLLKYDRSNLSPSEVMHLMNWITAPDHGAAVITSRPSIPPKGVFSTPEAEIGLKLVGLEELPMLGWGGMCWLGLQRQHDPQAFIKPSPIHALAGLRMALGESQEASLLAAVKLVESGQGKEGWRKFEQAHVCVFEDTPGGIKSLQAARQILSKMGIEIEMSAFGIGIRAVKTQALEANGAEVYSSINEALGMAIG
jgi:hypothetical protein